TCRNGRPTSHCSQTPERSRSPTPDTSPPWNSPPASPKSSSKARLPPRPRAASDVLSTRSTLCHRTILGGYRGDRVDSYVRAALAAGATTLKAVTWSFWGYAQTAICLSGVLRGRRQACACSHRRIDPPGRRSMDLHPLAGGVRQLFAGAVRRVRVDGSEGLDIPSNRS